MSTQATLVLGLDGVPTQPLQPQDLTFLEQEAGAEARHTALLEALGSLKTSSGAQHAELKALLAAQHAELKALLAAQHGELLAASQACTKVTRVTVNLAAALNDSAIALGTLTHVRTVTVADLTGAVVPTLKVNGTGEFPLPLVKGDVRTGLDATSLHVSCAAGGGQLVLELAGR